MKEARGSNQGWPVVGVADCPLCCVRRQVGNSKTEGRVFCLHCLELIDASKAIFIPGRESRKAVPKVIAPVIAEIVKKPEAPPEKLVVAEIVKKPEAVLSQRKESPSVASPTPFEQPVRKKKRREPDGHTAPNA